MNDPLAMVAAHPLAGVAATLGVYAAAWWLWRRTGEPALLHPTLVATALIAGALAASGIAYGEYFSCAALLHEALAVMVVLLAVPLWRRFGLIRAAGVPIAAAVALGGAIAIGSVLAAALAEGAPPEILATLAPKSSTAAVAVQISERFGGLPGLTALVVIGSGLFGAAFGPAILSAAGVHDHRAVGLALGVASHAIGTARAFQISETAGAFASVGMVLNALVTIGLVPLVLAAL